MATVNKDFRIKSGLVVEGANATVDGSDIITEEALVGGTQTNISVTYDAQTKTVSFVAESGIEDATTDDLDEGMINQYFTEQRVLDTVSGNLGTGIVYSAETAGNVFHIDENYLNTEITDGARSAISVEFGGTPLTYDSGTGVIGIGIAASGGINLDGSNDLQINRDFVDDWYDESGAAATAESNANTYTDGKIGNTFGKSVVGYLDDYYTTTANLDTAVGGLGYLKSADLTGYATETYVNDAVDALVDGAPGLLDTLNEIAAAINDDENYATTMTTALAGKQNNLTAGTNIDITADTISVTGLDTDDVSEGTNKYFTNARAQDSLYGENGIDYDNSGAGSTAGRIAVDRTVVDTWYDTAGAADTAEDNANAYTDTAIGALDTDDIDEGTGNLYFSDERAVDAISGADIYPNAVILNNLTKQVAATTDVAMLGTVTALSWSKTEYKTAKLIVKATDGANSHVSEVMLTLDGSGNVSITEYGIVYTDAEMISVTADVSSNDVRVRVTTLTPTVTLTVVGTLLV